MVEANATQLIELWKELLVKRGSVLLCHSFLPSLGRVFPKPSVVIDTLLEQLGPEGTLVVPAFTYSYFKGEIYDVENSNSTVGSLGDLAREYPMAVRSLDPNFSMVAIGRDADFLMQRDSIYSFGPGSVYDKLLQSEVYCLLLGVDYKSLPLFMHIEKCLRVPYRYDKEFLGESIYRGKLFNDSGIHFVRDEKLNPESDRMKVGVKIDDHSLCQKIFFGYGWHRLVSANVIVEVSEKSFSEDPFCFIKNSL